MYHLEATSSVDMETDDNIQATIATGLRGMNASTTSSMTSANVQLGMLSPPPQEYRVRSGGAYRFDAEEEEDLDPPSVASSQVYTLIMCS